MAQIKESKKNKRTIVRVKRGMGFIFLDKEGKRVSPEVVDRILKLNIPPAWRDVSISTSASDYIQAIGYDDKGRKQYIYHPEWLKKNQEYKFEQLISFGERLPTLREVVSSHMREHKLSQNRVVATVVWLLENTFIRVGNKTYAQDNKSYGLTTMREKHVDVEGNKVTFSFRGKSGVSHELGVTNPRVAKTIRACLDIPGYEVFQYFDDSGRKCVVNSSDVNIYLKSHTGADFSAKDFRTWGGTVIAGDSLYQKGIAQTVKEIKKNITETLATVSKHLGNTKKVCRVYYIHPTIISSYENQKLVPYFERAYKRKVGSLLLTPEEYAAWSLIKNS